MVYINSDYAQSRIIFRHNKKKDFLQKLLKAIKKKRDSYKNDEEQEEKEKIHVDGMR